MHRLRLWLRDHLDRRPAWMNAVMFFCAFATVVYVPWDFFLKPVAEDKEAWFGFLLSGYWAKATEPLHWLIYCSGWYGFWRMRSWMWPWAALYSAQLTVGMLVWGVAYVGGVGGFVMALASAAPFALLTRALWDARERFEGPQHSLIERYPGWAVITGASAGIGAEYARALAREGYSCVLVARREQRLRELAEELEQSWKVETRIIAADLAEAGADAVVAAQLEDLEIGLLVNNAGVGYAGAFLKQESERLTRMIQLNCVAPVALTHRLLPKLVDRDRSAVIIVGSLAGRQPVPFMSVYSATKGFDLLVGEGLWLELREHGIDVQVVQPGPVATEFEEVAGEKRSDPELDQSPYDVVKASLETLGLAPSIATSWRVLAVAALSRIAPRTLAIFASGALMERQTPPEQR
jgi:short-subunit dehydrogenase